MGKLTIAVLLAYFKNLKGVFMSDTKDAPESDDAKEALKGFLSAVTASGDTTTFSAKGTGTRYLTIATAKGLMLAVTPKVKAAPIIGIFLRVRAQKAEVWANLDDANQLFGFPFLDKSDVHKSVEVYVPVAKLPATVQQIGKAIETNKLIKLLVDTVCDRVEKAGAQISIPRDTIIEYIRNIFMDAIPSEDPALKLVPEFTVAIGEKEIITVLKKAIKHFADQPAQPAAKPGTIDPGIVE